MAGARRRVRRAWPSGSATAWCTARCSRTSASSSGWAPAPTSSARRCTTSATRATGTWRCAPRPRPRWPGPSCSTGRRCRGRCGALTPAFRYERPQAGRLRQHHQVDVEALGVADPDMDVEIVAAGRRLPAALGLRRWRLALNTMGTPADRAALVDRCRPGCATGWVTWRPTTARRSRPTRCGSSTPSAPRPRPWWPTRPAWPTRSTTPPPPTSSGCRPGLSALGIPFEVEPRLVRGLDYYTHTLFEFQSLALDSAQSTVIGGGRYDGLVEQLGGPPTPGIGFGVGHRADAAGARRRGRLRRPGDHPRRVRGRRHRRVGGPRPHRRAAGGRARAPTGPSTGGR